MSLTARRLIPLLVMAALSLAGCGNDTDAVTEDETTGPPEDMEGSQEAGADHASDGARGEESEVEDAAEGGSDDVADVRVGSTELGDVLVDADGMTLYLFTNDTDGRSGCYDGCAAAWPPLTVGEAPAAGDRVDAGLLGTIERDDGAIQVTYNGWPLYTWASDSDPGDVTGQGINDVWFVVAPDGEAIMGSGGATADPDGY